MKFFAILFALCWCSVGIADDNDLLGNSNNDLLGYVALAEKPSLTVDSWEVGADLPKPAEDYLAVVMPPEPTLASPAACPTGACQVQPISAVRVVRSVLTRASDCASCSAGEPATMGDSTPRRWFRWRIFRWRR